MEKNLRINNLETCVQYYENALRSHEIAYVKLQNHCVLCGTTLELKFEKIEDGKVKEEANCPECELRTRVKTYVIQ